MQEPQSRRSRSAFRSGCKPQLDLLPVNRLSTPNKFVNGYTKDYKYREKAFKLIDAPCKPTSHTMRRQPIAVAPLGPLFSQFQFSMGQLECDPCRGDWKDERLPAAKQRRKEHPPAHARTFCLHLLQCAAVACGFRVSPGDIVRFTGRVERVAEVR